MPRQYEYQNPNLAKVNQSLEAAGASDVGAAGAGAGADVGVRAGLGGAACFLAAATVGGGVGVAAGAGLGDGAAGVEAFADGVDARDPDANGG